MCWVGVLVRGRYGDTLEGIRGEHWGDRIGFGGGCTACAGGVCVHGNWFPSVKRLTDKFLVFTYCLSGFWLVGISFSESLRFSVWVVWLFRGWPGLSRGDLGCHLSLLCLVLCVRL